MISGYKRPMRLHQEDFCQALGIPSSRKYALSTDDNLKRAFQIISSYSKNPIEDVTAFWKMICFDYLVGNTDNHLKNFSLLYSADLSCVSLAPAYDIISTTIYEGQTREMGIAINGKLNIDEITEEDLFLEAKKSGMSAKTTEKIYSEMKTNFTEALISSAKELKKSGVKKVLEVCEKIIESAESRGVIFG